MTSRPCQVGSTFVTRVSQIFVQAKKPGNEFVREPCSNNLLDKFICSCRRRNKCWPLRVHACVLWSQKQNPLYSLTLTTTTKGTYLLIRKNNSTQTRKKKETASIPSLVALRARVVRHKKKNSCNSMNSSYFICSIRLSTTNFN